MVFNPSSLELDAKIRLNDLCTQMRYSRGEVLLEFAIASLFVEDSEVNVLKGVNARSKQKQGQYLLRSQRASYGTDEGVEHESHIVRVSFYAQGVCRARNLGWCCYLCTL